MKPLEGPELFNPVMTSEEGVVLCCQGRTGEQTDCGWAKDLAVFLGAVGITEREGMCYSRLSLALFC